jgi:hypothetical protein
VWILRHLPKAAGALTTAVLIAACASQPAGEVVARVGAVAITRSALDHWTAVLMGGRGSPASSGSSEATRQRALAYLISARWLVGEAAHLGAAPSREEIHERVEERVQQSFPGGQRELREFQKATGQTVADLELEATVELASSRLPGLVSANVPRTTPAQIVAYYRVHPLAFTVPEVIEVTLTDRKTPAAAAHLIEAVRAGKSFAVLSLRLTVERPPGMTARNATEPLAGAIYAARPNVLTGPVRQGPDYAVFEVKRKVPPRLEPLRQVSAAIARQLHASALQHALAAAVRAWRARWTAMTSCSPGHVVQKCRQYSGPRTTEAPLEFN